MGYDVKTGHFILTLSKARLWLRVDDASLGDTDAIASRLREFGVGVHAVCPAWVRCDMRPGAVWEALRREQPPTAQVVRHWTQRAKKLHPTWAMKELSGKNWLADEDMGGRTSVGYR